MPIPPFDPDTLAFRPGQSIRSAVSRAWSLALVAALRRLAVIVAEGGPLRAEYTTAGTVLSVDLGQLVRVVRTPAGGVAARSGTTPGSAGCQRVTWDGADLGYPSGETIDCLNPFSTAAGASKIAVAFRWAGAWWLATWEC